MSQPSVCRSGCGFYGSPATDGHCSKCYKDALKRKQAAPPGSAASVVAQAAGRSSPFTSSEATSAAVASASQLIEEGLKALSSQAQAQELSQTIPTELSPPLSEPIIIDPLRETSATTLTGPLLASSTTSPTSPSATVSAAANAAAGPSPLIASSSTPVADPTAADDAPKKKKKNKCTHCKVNVGILGFPCRCGGMFCATHRYANEHQCTFDYREHGQEEIRKNNPQVVGQKIQKI